MTFSTLLRTIPAALAAVCLTFLGACGGGGGGGGDGGAASPSVVFLRADLRGDAETTVVDPDAGGIALLELHADGTLAFACTVDPDFAADVSGLHIHRGAAGDDGPVEVDLLSDGAAFSSISASAHDGFSIDPALAAEIVAGPGAFYVNVHTAAAPDGLARGQLAAMGGDELHALLLGENESRIVFADARGGCTLRIEADFTLSWQLAMRAPAIADIVAAHIHVGAGGVDGSVLVDLDPTAGALDVDTGLLAGTVEPPLRALSRLAHRPDGFYVNVHTEGAPEGVARGPLGRGTVELWAALKGSEEVTPPSDPDARGGVTLQLHGFSTGTVHMAVPTTQGIETIVEAHVHDGPSGADGPAVIDLLAGEDFVRSVGSFSAEGSISCDRSLFTRMLADPAAFYVNFHTAVDPAGAVRGQLGQAPVQFAAALDGSEEVTVVDAMAGGRALVLVRGIFECSFSIHMDAPAASDVLAGHVHDGATGVNGPVLIDLLGGTDVSVSGDDITGRAHFTGRTFARLLAFPERFYVNVHTALAPAGIARGQLELRDESIPPSGLAYATPVTYSEGVEITPNVPTVGGGAVASYGISPALPAGLGLDPVSGVISGTPTSAAAFATYTVQATNASGSATTTIDLTVQPQPPTNLSYTSPVTYTVGTAIPSNTPTVSGGAVTSYTVSPSLPAGLSLNASTGVISGTPTSASSVAVYTVTASNVAGSTTFGISITVNSSLQPPSSLSYTTPVSYPTGYAISANNPTISGGAVTSWSISPSLPTGLSFSASSGVISGTPTSTSSATNYTVTAANAAGSTTATVNITVTLGAPANLSYTNSPNIGYVNTAIASMQPSSTGGAVSSYSISPSLPSGLSLNASTGVISGTPTTTSPSTNYTVTASNATGSTTTTITIIVY